jgi:hypothetical protein
VQVAVQEFDCAAEQDEFKGVAIGVDAEEVS